MKSSKFSAAHKAFILKRGADGVSVADLCRNALIRHRDLLQSEEKSEGMLPTDRRRMTSLEDENAKLHKLVVDLSLGEEMLQDVLAESFKAC